MEENLAGLYKDLLVTETNPIPVLAKMLWQVTNRSSNSDYARIGKLIKLYGRHNVYLGLLDLAEYNKEITGDPFNLLTYMIRSNVNTEQPLSERIDVKKIAVEQNKVKRKKLKPKDISDDTV